MPRCENQNLYSARLVLFYFLASKGLLVAIARIAAKREEDQVPFATLRSCVFSSVLLHKCRCKIQNLIGMSQCSMIHRAKMIILCNDEEWWLMTMIPTMNDEWWRVNMVNGGHTCLVVTSMTSPLAGADCRIDRNLTGSFGAPGSRPRASTRNTLITRIPIHYIQLIHFDSFRLICGLWFSLSLINISWDFNIS